MYLTVSRLLENKAKEYEGKVIDIEKTIKEAENDCNENDQVAPGTQQVEIEDAEIGPTESEQYVHFNPDGPIEHRQYDMSREVGIEARPVELTNHAIRISECDYFTLIRSLNKKQWEFFQHVVMWCTQKIKVKAVDTVCGDLPLSVKSNLRSSLPEKQFATANFAKEAVVAIGMKYDLTANIEVTNGLTNDSTCELKLIESKTRSLRPSIVWVKFEDDRLGLVSITEGNMPTCMEKMSIKIGFQFLTLKDHILTNSRPLK
ncbi:unnamed protein product [Mytilus coruscus]|uniref:Uncharacterized protein n=1 Tax=Mytilus coruscus TaxID=42192 RepID=A0A6J8DCD1_MYTCO|nr:unnamed protein product [Mytilus coruscus]